MLHKLIDKCLYSLFLICQLNLLIRNKFHQIIVLNVGLSIFPVMKFVYMCRYLIIERLYSCLIEVRYLLHILSEVTYHFIHGNGRRHIVVIMPVFSLP